MIPLRVAVASDLPSRTAAVGLPVFAGFDVPPGRAADLDRSYAEQCGFTGKLGQTLAIPYPEGATLVALGLGERPKAGLEEWRRAAAAFVRAAWQAPAGAIDLRGLDLEAGIGPTAAAVAEGAGMASYRFDLYKGDPGPERRLGELTVVASDLGEATSGAARGCRIAEAVALARDLVNEPGGSMTPSRLADEALKVGKAAGLQVEVLDEREIATEGLGGLAGVARGSSQPPRLIRLVYEARGRDGHRADAVATVALVGKGITFDSGGLSIKSAEAMSTQKTDMSGAAAVLATMSALGDLDVGVRVVGIVPTTENMPGPGALKPGDVLRTRNGKTIEVLNTDAEGRLILADGLALAAEARPDAIIDLATLTGACVVALGREIAGLMGNDDALVREVEEASRRAGEPMWRLPLPEAYRSHIDSDVADMKNTGHAGEAGTLAAALLLAEFVDDVPWAHIDIAGPARSTTDEGYQRKGGTGFGVRTLLELLTAFQPVQAG